MCLCKQRKGGRRGVRDGPRLFTERIMKRVALTRHLTLSFTDEATAVVEAQALHAFGEDECTDITGEATAATEGQVLHAFGEDECADITCEGRRSTAVRKDGMGESTAAHEYREASSFTETISELYDRHTYPPCLTFQLPVTVEVEFPKVGDMA